MALVAFVAAVGFILAGPATDASAAPTPTPTPNSTPPGPAADSPANEPGLLFKLGWYAYGWAHHPLDRHDRYYQAKLPAKIFIQRMYKWMTEGKTSLSIKSDVPNTLDDAATWYRESRKTEKSLKKQLTKAEQNIRKRNEQVATAMTRAERAQAKQKRQASVNQHNQVSRELRELKETAPETPDMQVKTLNEQARNLKSKVRRLERIANDPQQKKARRAEAQQQLGAAQKALSQVEAERDRLRGDDGPDEAGGARPTKPGPKNPPKGPSTGGTNLPKESVISSIKPPKFGVKIPRWGRGRGTGMTEMIGELAGQAYSEHVENEHEQLLKKALADDTLRKRIIDDYHQIEDDNAFETLGRAFDTSKEFTQGSTRDIGPKLIEHQKKLDTTKATAEKSSKDPLYQRARKKCGGYDTCVTERTRKLREQNAKAIAKSTKKAEASNKDPLYLQARKECGGYDTCVTERTRKLREQNAKTTTAKSQTKKDTKPSKQDHKQNTEARQPRETATAGKKTTNLRQPL
ncbi:hypothetical protein ABT282_36205 [Streptomyces sp. NPDC000927]|uniref:hypothetical protein n=1 Tax=Streptomyces sp. NPDC000927 TaxID=3154371 RepID=UPI00331B7E49